MHRSFWLQEALGDAPDQPPLEGAARADIAIMGGGFVGLWTAIRIKERDPACDVVVLEQDVCGGGASGRNGGEVLSWWAKAGKLVDLCGREEAIRIGKASVDAIGEIEEFCNAHGIDADFNRGGYLWTATTEAQLGAWDSTVELLRDLGAPALELLEPAEVARRAGSPVHIAGVLDPSAATVQPAKLARGLRRVALEMGVRIHENSRVTDLDRRSPAVLRTQNGVLTADRVVIATNAWAASMRELHTRLVVISSDIILTEEAPDRLAEIGWTGYEAISDSQVMIHYYRRTPQGRVMFGKGGWGIAMAGRLPASFDRHEGRARDVEANFRRIYPTLADVQGRARLVGADRPCVPRAADLRAPGRARAPHLRRRLERQRRRPVGAGRQDPGVAGAGRAGRVVAVAVRRRALRPVPARPRCGSRAPTWCAARSCAWSARSPRAGSHGRGTPLLRDSLLRGSSPRRRRTASR